ncbi:MAG: MFS transporter [Opitutales bacterium]|nr:MFS transporter [Opitutales bacterium]
MPPPASPDPSPTAPPAAPAGPKLYKVGTLTYTKTALLQVVFWMLWGDFIFQLLESMPTVTPLLLRWHGASDLLIGLAGSLSSVVSFLWYPVVATQSDRHRGPLGRRRPFLLWFAPPVLLSLMLLGAAKPAGVWLHRFLSAFGGDTFTVAGCSIAWIMGCVVVFLLFNAYIVQVFACLVADVIPVEVMGKFAGFYRAVGALGSLTFNRWILGWVEQYTFHVYLLVGLLFAGAFSVIIWKVKEGEYPPPPPKTPGGPLAAIQEYFQTCFRHPFYLNFFTVTFFFWASLVPLGFVVFFGTQAGKTGYAPTLGLSLQDFGEVKGWTYLVSIPVFFVVGFFVDRFHAMRVAILGMLLTALSYFCCFWFVADKSSLLLWWSLNQAAIAVYLGASMALGPRLLPRERYGQFVSANLIFGMVGLIFSPPLIGWLIQRIADYRYVFVFCGALTSLALLALLALHAQWQRLGGEKNFVPPDPVRPPAHAPAP